MTVSGKEEALCRDPTQAECAAQIDLALPDDAAVLLSSSAYARFDDHRPRGQQQRLRGLVHAIDRGDLLRAVIFGLNPNCSLEFGGQADAAARQFGPD